MAFCNPIMIDVVLFRDFFDIDLGLVSTTK